MTSKADIDAFAVRLSRADPDFDLQKYRRLVQKQDHEESIARPRKKKLPKYVRQQVAAQRGSAAPKRNTSTVKKSSKLEKSIKKSLRKSLGFQGAARQRAQAAVVAKAVPNLRAQLNQRIARLEAQVRKSEASNNPQNGWGAAFALHRAQADLAAVDNFAKAAVPDFNSFDQIDHYMAHPAANEQNASRAATSRAIASAQGDPIGQHLGRKTPLDVMNDVLRGTGQAEQVRDFEAQAKKAAADLKAATTPAEREAAAYVQTRAQLMLGHLKGEI